MSAIEAEQRIIELCYCVVCNELMLDGIDMCIMGHSFCTSCSEKVVHCPICRAAIMEDTRNHIMQKIIQKLKFSCKNRDKGCKADCKGSELKDHESECGYTSRECPLKEAFGCSWFGYAKDVLHHCYGEHPNNTFASEVVNLTCPNFTGQCDLYAILDIKQEVVLVKCSVKNNLTTTEWGISVLGNRSMIKRLRYTVSLPNPDVMENLTCVGRCLFSMDEGDDAKDESFVTILSVYSSVSKFANTLIGIIERIKSWRIFSIRRC